MQFLRLRRAMCRFLGLPQQTAEARQKAADIIDDIDEGWRGRSKPCDYHAEAKRRIEEAQMFYDAILARQRAYEILEEDRKAKMAEHGEGHA